MHSYIHNLRKFGYDKFSQGIFKISLGNIIHPDKRGFMVIQFIRKKIFTIFR